MQKVIRRTAMAKNQYARKAQRRTERIAREQHKALLASRFENARSANADVKAARQARREDWELGPLAPRRDVGDKRETYGTLEMRRLKLEEVPEKERVKFWNIVEGDRVVILEGRDKGKIGVVKKLEKNSNAVEVEGLNMVDIAIPEFMLKNDPNKTPVRSVEQAVPLSSVRLVFPLEDPESGVTRDVIVKKIVNGSFWFDKHSRVQRFSRFIPGLNVRIPWPKKEQKEYKDNPIDTLRTEVEARTWVPTLLVPPMPETVVDELRNKYSIFRDRHDEEYIAKKMAEDEEIEKKKKQVELVRTPLKEVNRKARKLRKAKGKGVLTREMLIRIGEVIAKKKAVLAESAPPPSQTVAA